MNQYLTGQNITKYHADQLIFEGVTFSIHEKQKIVLVGPNGTGKTTLLKIIAGIDPPDSGAVQVIGSATIGYADQHVKITAHTNIYQYMLDAIHERLAILDELSHLEHKLAQVSFDTEQFTKVSNQYERLRHEAEQLGVYALETKIKMLLTKFGFRETSWTQYTDQLSGGQQVRLTLARLLLIEPDVLLLDEPTNHLDIETIIWLDAYLSKYPKAIVLISHDEKLLTSLATHVWQIFAGELLMYNGNYANYKTYLREHANYLAKQQLAADEQKAKLDDFIAKNKARASTAKRAQSAMKKRAKMEDTKQLKVLNSLTPFHLPVNRPSGKHVFTLYQTKIGYNKPLYDPINLAIMRYDRIALVGKNGIGKSTLLAALNGKQQVLLEGEITTGHHVDIAFFEQQQVFQKTNCSVYETFATVYPDANREVIHPILARFGFSQEEVYLVNTHLSGGEKQRLLLALLYYQKANTLLLDEPTNHLDLQSKQSLTDALLSFDGTVVFASHDREFIETVATKIVFFHQGRISYFDSFAAFEAYSLAQDSPTTSSSTQQTTAQLSRSEQKMQQAKIRRLNNQIEQIEQEIEQLEATIATLEEQLLTEAVYSDFVRATEITTTIANLTAKLDDCMQQWEVLQHEVDNGI